MSTIAFERINFASLLAITALIFLLLVVFGLGRPGFAAESAPGFTDSLRVVGATEPHAAKV